MGRFRGEIASEGVYSERGVVLNCFKFSDTQMIAQILTSSRGRRSYICKIKQGKGGRGFRTADHRLLRPLAILNFQANEGSNNIDRIWQAEPAMPLMEISLDITKSAIAIFVSEMMFRVLREPVDDPNLYRFVEASVLGLDKMESGVGNFHLWFMIHLAFFLGYQFPGGYKSGSWLDIKHGEYVGWRPSHNLRVAPEFAEIISRLSRVGLDEITTVEMNREKRVTTLHAIVDYYSFHTDTINSVRSISMLGELF